MNWARRVRFGAAILTRVRTQDIVGRVAVHAILIFDTTVEDGHDEEDKKLNL